MTEIILQPPEVVYQVERDRKGSVLHKLTLVVKPSPALSKYLASVPTDELKSAITVAVRRFDHKELELAVKSDDGEYTMLGFRLSVAMMVFEWVKKSRELKIALRQDELPLSRSFGDAPFVFVIHFPAVDEILVSRVFHVLSKSSSRRRTQYFIPKRYREVQDRRGHRSYTGPPDAAEAKLDEALHRMNKARRVDRSDDDGGDEEEVIKVPEYDVDLMNWDL